MPETAARRLAGPLLLSGLLHLGAGYSLHRPNQPPSALDAARLRVSIRSAPEASLKPPGNLPPPLATARVQRSPSTQIRRRTDAEAPTSAANPGLRAASQSSQPAPTADAATLIERGTAAWRDELRQTRLRAERLPRFTPAAPTTARHNDGPEVEHLHGELIRVTLPDGRRYCLQAPPETLRQQMPLPLLVLPSNCS